MGVLSSKIGPEKSDGGAIIVSKFGLKFARYSGGHVIVGLRFLLCEVKANASSPASAGWPSK